MKVRVKGSVFASIVAAKTVSQTFVLCEVEVHSTSIISTFVLLPCM